MKDRHLADTFFYTAQGVLLALSWGLAVGGVLYLLCVWPSVPDYVGYHFDADGTFNLFGGKNIAFWHPIIAEALMLLLLSGGAALATRVRPVKRFSPVMHAFTTRAVALFCDVFALSCAIIFTHWITCVAHQTSLHTTLVSGIFIFITACLALLVLYLVFAFIFSRRHSKESA